MKGTAPMDGARIRDILRNWKVLSILGLLTSFTVILVLFGKSSDMQSPLIIHAGTPFSNDPLDYDAFTHHMTQRPVLGTLVSNYKSGEVIGVLASGWSVSSDRRIWTFKMREGLLFENGDSIDAQAVVRSLTRAAFLMKQKRSQSGLFERLVGFMSLSSIDGPFEGLTSEDSGRSVRFEFQSSEDNVLDKLSFGLYAVAHPSDWDSQSGAWRDSKSVVSSGPYAIEEWTDSGLTLFRRTGFPLEKIYGNREPFEFVRFVFGTPLADLTEVHVVTGLKGEPYSEKHVFRGEANNGILFVRIMGQLSETSPWNSINLRREAREVLYKELNNIGHTPIRSFLPLALEHVAELQDPQSSFVARSLSRGMVRICDYKTQTGIRKTIAEALIQSLESLGYQTEMLSIPPPEMAKGFDHKNYEVACDMAVILTGILLSDPWDDLRFMVRSTEGIRLPDPTGQLEKNMAKESIDIQEFNRQLWDDALVWPITHTTSGLWIRPDVVSLDLVNLSHPPSELALFRKGK